jgi:RNA polymerase sigma factor (sigma-70 family)
MKQVIETDEVLFVKYLNGNKAAFKTLYQRYQDRLYGIAFSITKDSSTADDVVQEVLLKVHRFRSQYKPSQPFIAWLYRIAQNTALDHCRSAKRSASVDVFNADVPVINPVDRRLVSADEQSKVCRILCRLTDDQREILVLRFFLGIKHKDTAEICGVAVNTAKGRMKRALAAFKESWNQ